MSKHKPIPSPLTDSRVRRSRAGLRAALLGLLKEKSLAEITIRDVAAAADIGYTTYFRHYPSKEALLYDLVTDEVARLTAFAAPVYERADARAACLAFCRYIDQNRQLWTVLLTGGAAGSVREEFIRQSLTAPVGRKHAQPGWIPPGLTATLVASVMIELLAWWLRQPKPMSAAQVAEILDRFAISPAEALVSGEPEAKASRAKVLKTQRGVKERKKC